MIGMALPVTVNDVAGDGSLRIAVATPFVDLYSETFVAAHIRGLRRVELLLHGSTLPLFVHGGGSLLRPGVWGRLCDRLEALMHGGGLNDLLAHRIARTLVDHGIQVVLAEYGTTADRMAPICRSVGIPLVAHFHGFDAFKHAVLEEHHGYRTLFATAARMVTPSAHMRDHLVSLGAGSDLIDVIPCGVDLQRFATAVPASVEPHLLAVGRFVPKKCMADVVNAFRIVHAKYPDARLTFVGDGPDRLAVQGIVASSGLQDAVTFAGVCTHDQVAQLMGRSTLLVQASATAPDGDKEATTLVIAEAMASGLPVVATRHAGIPELLEHGVSGWLVAENDVAALASRIIHVLDHPEQAFEMGRAGRSFVQQRFDQKEALVHLQEVLASVVAGRSSGSS
jgi:glycosyltransferase involved in cell wall biosynthesis